MQGPGKTTCHSPRLEKLRAIPPAKKAVAGASRVELTAPSQSVHPQGFDNRTLFPPRAASYPFSSQVSYVASHPFSRSRNPLVQRSTVGKAKPLYRESDAVPPEHYYGYKAPQHPKNNARAVLHEWQLHRPSPLRQDIPNFRAMNKRGLGHGAITAKGLASYKKTNPVISSRRRVALPRISPVPFQDDPFHCYGYKAPPEPGMRQLIQNTYGLAQMQLLARRCQAHDGNRKADESKMRRIRLTKAAWGHASGRHQRHGQPGRNPYNGGLSPRLVNHQRESIPELFKIKKFLKVPSRTSTWWTSYPL